MDPQIDTAQASIKRSLIVGGEFMIQDTAQRRAEAWMTQHGCYGGTMLIDLANLLQDTRRDALTEARRAISKLYDEAHTESADYYTALLDAGLTLDRLREGVEG